MLSFVTVVYSKDYPLLRLQALSLARFVPPEIVASIHVILNDIDEQTLRARIDPILPCYGPLRAKVQVLSGDDVLLGEGHYSERLPGDRVFVENRFRWPLIRKGGWRGNNGYRTQQVLKLGAARVAASENIVILDTKNLLLRQVEHSDFFSYSGQARLPFMTCDSSFHRNWLRESLNALAVPYPGFDSLKTTIFSTPFPVPRSLILRLLNDINARYGSVQSLFASRRRPSEFMLMNAFCLKSPEGYGPWFEDARPLNIGLWPTYSQDQLATLVAQLDDPAALSLGLHNRALAMLPQNLRDRVFTALDHRGICDRTIAEGVLQETAALSG